MTPALHAALSAVFAVHAIVFGYLGLVRRKQPRPVVLGAGFAFLALGQLVQATFDPLPVWHPAVVWTGRGLCLVALAMLVAARVRARGR